MTIAYPDLAPSPPISPLIARSAAFLHLARYRTRKNLKPHAARCRFLRWLAPLTLMQKSLRPMGDVFAYWVRSLMCKGRQLPEQAIEIERAYDDWTRLTPNGLCVGGHLPKFATSKITSRPNRCERPLRRLCFTGFSRKSTDFMGSFIECLRVVGCHVPLISNGS